MSKGRGGESRPVSFMTKKTIGRPTKAPPADCADKLREWSAIGYSKKHIAYRMGTTLETLNKWMIEQPQLAEAFEAGREREHHALFNALFTQATTKANVTAAIFLLKSRHGYREGDQSDTANRVSITFQLPGAIPMDKYVASLNNVVGSKGKSGPQVIDHE